MQVRQYGLQRTGTNAVRAIIEANYPAKVTGLGKHLLPERGDVEAADAVVVSVRHPASWLVSYHRFRAMKRRDEGLAIDPIEVLAPEWLEHWTRVTRAHLQAAGDAKIGHVVPHGTLVRWPALTAIKLGEALGLASRDVALELFEGRHMSRGGDSTPGSALATGRDFDRDYYITGAWKADLPVSVHRMASETLSGLDWWPDSFNDF